MTSADTLAIPSIAVILETQPGAPKLRITPSQNPEGVMTKLLKLPVFRSFVTPPPDEAKPPKPARRGILKNKSACGTTLAEPKAVRFSDDVKAFDSPVNRTRSRPRPRSNSAPLPPRSAWGAPPDYAAQAKAERQARLAANQAQAEADASTSGSQPLLVPRRKKARVVAAPPVPEQAPAPAPPSPGPRSPSKKPRPPPIVTMQATARGHPVYPTNVPRLPRHAKGFRMSLPASPMTVSTAIPRALAPAPPVWAGPPSPISPAPPPMDVQARLRRAIRDLGVDHLSAEKRRELARDVKHELARATRARFEDPGDRRIGDRVTYLSLLLHYVKAQPQTPAAAEA